MLYGYTMNISYHIAGCIVAVVAFGIVVVVVAVVVVDESSFAVGRFAVVVAVVVVVVAGDPGLLQKGAGLVGGRRRRVFRDPLASGRV